MNHTPEVQAARSRKTHFAAGGASPPRRSNWSMTVKILGIDPSSTRTGWAVLDATGQLLDAGYITGRSNATAPDRVICMVDGVVELLKKHIPQGLTQIVVELPGARVHRNNAGHGNGLPVYGMAAGAVWMACRLIAHRLSHEGLPDVVVESAIETEWTRRIPKPVRRRQIAALYPVYRCVEARDGGGDISDAIGLCLWRQAVIRKASALRQAKDV